MVNQSCLTPLILPLILKVATSAIALVIVCASCSSPINRYEMRGSGELTEAQAQAVLAHTEFVGEQRLDEPLRLLRWVAPIYSNEAMAIDLEGLVKVRAQIDESGKVASVQVVSSPHTTLSNAASDAVKQWRFKPMTEQGKPASFVIIQDFIFVIRDGLPPS